MEQDDIDTNYLIKLSNVYLNIDEYNKAYSVANKSIGLGKNIEKGLVSYHTDVVKESINDNLEAAQAYVSKGFAKYGVGNWSAMLKDR